jgi:hypothetical protein
MSSRHSTRQLGKAAERRGTREIARIGGGPPMVDCREGNNMGWVSRFRVSGKAEPVDPSYETVINGTPYDAHKATRSIPENPATAGAPRDAQIAEEIKRRQVSLAVRYVAAVRAR